MTTGKRKFYKINSLYDVFKEVVEDDKTVYKTSLSGDSTGCFTAEFLEQYSEKIDEHTILFITAADKDEGRFVKIVPKNVVDDDDLPPYEDSDPLLHELKQGDTMIWARGDLYSVSTKSVREIKRDETDNTKLIITYSDGTVETIIPNPQLPYTGTYPVNVDADRNISLQDISIEQSSRNIIFNTDANNLAATGVKYAHIEGNNNTATANYQHIEGKYADAQNTYAFIIGDGNATSGASNLFVIRFDGYVFTKSDFVAGGTIDNPLYKLSDIHSVLEVDWAFIGSDETDNSFNDEDFSTQDYQ